MRLINANPKVKTLLNGAATEITINNTVYKILSFFELANNPDEVLVLNWNNIEELSYTDDISLTGLTGFIVLNSPGGLYDDILNMINDIYFGLYLYNEATGFEENIYFSVVDSYMVEGSRSSNGCLYRLTIQEAFMAEGSTKNFATLDLGITGEATALTKLSKSFLAKLGIAFAPVDFHSGKDIYDFLEYVIGLISTEVSTKAKTGDIITANSLELQESKNTKRIIDLDINSIEYFRTSYPDTILGNAIYQNIISSDSCYDVLHKINRYFVYQNTNADSTSINATLQGEMATCRSENISKSINKTNIDTNLQGERKLILRSLRDIFTSCFLDNTVYEIITDVNTLGNYQTSKKYSFLSGLTPNGQMVKKYPINLDFVFKEWCDYIVAPLNEADSFTGLLYKFKDIIDYFNKNFLYSKEVSNIAIDENLSRGITKKEPFFGASELSYSTFAKTVKSLFTLNELIELRLPGNIHRKANEIIYIDDSLRKNDKNLTGTQATMNNLFAANYYYTTRVIHTFKGAQYTNQLFLCNFSNKKAN